MLHNDFASPCFILALLCIDSMCCEIINPIIKYPVANSLSATRIFTFSSFRGPLVCRKIILNTIHVHDKLNTFEASLKYTSS